MLAKDFNEFVELLNSTGVDLPITGLDEFRANKRASGRAKDLADPESLESPEDDNGNG